MDFFGCGRPPLTFSFDFILCIRGTCACIDEKLLRLEIIILYIHLLLMTRVLLFVMCERERERENSVLRI